MEDQESAEWGDGWGTEGRKGIARKERRESARGRRSVNAIGVGIKGTKGRHIRRRQRVSGLRSRCQARLVAPAAADSAHPVSMHWYLCVDIRGAVQWFRIMVQHNGWLVVRR